MKFLIISLMLTTIVHGLDAFQTQLQDFNAQIQEARNDIQAKLRSLSEEDARMQETIIDVQDRILPDIRAEAHEVVTTNSDMFDSLNANANEAVQSQRTPE